MSVAVDPSSKEASKTTSILYPDVKDTTEEGVKDAIGRARKEFNTWSRLSFRERAKHLALVRHALADSVEEIVDVIVSDTGKVPTEALVNEVIVTVDLMRWYESHGEKALASI